MATKGLMWKIAKLWSHFVGNYSGDRPRAAARLAPPSILAIAREESFERPQAFPGLPYEYPFLDWIEYESQDAGFSHR